MESLQGLLWSLAYKHMFRISCLSSLLSSGNFFEARRPLNSTAEFQISDSYKKALTDLFEVVRNVARQDHLRYDLAHVPVLRLRQQLEDVVLRVQQQLEGDRAVVVLEHAAVVVAQRLRVLHRDQERVVVSPTEITRLNELTGGRRRSRDKPRSPP